MDDRHEYYTENIVLGEFGGDIETGENPNFGKYVLDYTYLDIITSHVKKKSYESIRSDLKVNEEDYYYYINYVFYDMWLQWNKKNKKKLGFVFKDIIDGDGNGVKPLNLVYKFIVLNYDRSLNGNYNKIIDHSFNYIYGDNSKMFCSDDVYDFMCVFTDDELYCLLRDFYVTFSKMLMYIVLKYGISESFIESRRNWIDETFIRLSKEYNTFDSSIFQTKLYDIKYDINLFFKIKYFMNDCKNIMVKRVDSYITNLNSYLFLCLFYESIKHLNSCQYYEDYVETKNTMLIYEDLYNYFYRKIYV